MDHDYSFRNANEREKEAFHNYLLYSRGMGEQEADETVEAAHIGILEGYQGDTPSYVGKVFIVFYGNVNMYEVFTYSENDALREVEQH